MTWGGGEYAALCQAFLAEDPEQALSRGLSWLESLGIRSVPSAEEASLTVSVYERHVHLSFVAALAEHETQCLGAVVHMALARAYEASLHQQTRERLDMLSAASFEGIMVNVNGDIIDANERLGELLGMSREETLGTETFRRCVAPEDIQATAEKMQQGYEGAYVITGVRKDGSRFRAELQSKQGKLGERPVRVVAVRDVTERERTLRLLRESEQRFRELARAAFDVTLLVKDDVILDAEGPIQELYGVSREEFIGSNAWDYVAPSELPMVSRLIDEEPVGSWAMTMRRPDGALIPVDVVTLRTTLAGEPVHLAGVKDRREVLRKERERRRLEQQVERAQRMESLGVLAGGIAHDFNNILVGMLGNADLLLGQAEDPEEREMLTAIVAAGEKAAGLTTQMLAYAGRAESGPVEAVDVGALLKQLQVLLDASLSKRARLELSVDGETRVLAETTTLSQLLMNFLTNASDALGGKDGTVSVRVQTVIQPGADWELALGANISPGKWVLIEIEDTGCGMSEDTQARIFEPFFTTKEQGHGLGLAACLGIVKAFGGAIRLRSAPGEGTCFSVLLPAAVGAKEVVAGGGDTEPPAPCHVLVVDDEALVRQQLRRSLELRGYTVLEAPDGPAALLELRKGQRGERPGIDLLVVDLTMPKMDGAELINAIRQAGYQQPIVLASGYLNAEAEQRLSAGSFQAFLRKPYLVSELLQALERAQKSDATSATEQ